MTRTQFYKKAARALIANEDHVQQARRYLLLVRRWRVLRRADKPANSRLEEHQRQNRRERRQIERVLHDALEKYVHRRFMAIVPRSALESAVNAVKQKELLLARTAKGDLLLNGKVFYRGHGDGAGVVTVYRADLLDLISRRGEALMLDFNVGHWTGWHSWAEGNQLKSGEPILYAYPGQSVPKV